MLKKRSSEHLIALNFTNNNTHWINMMKIAPIHDKEIEINSVPSETLKLLTNNDSLVARKAGIFTLEDLINIKRYINYGLSLPINTKEITIEIELLTDVDLPISIQVLLDLFIEIRIHALSWNNVEFQVKQQSIDIELTGRNITQTGNLLLEYINQMPIIDKINKTLSDLNQADIENIRYNTDDAIIACELVNILILIKDDIYNQAIKTVVVRNAVSDFRMRIIGGELTTFSHVDSLLFKTKKLKQQLEISLDQIDKQKIEDVIEVKKNEVFQLENEYDNFVKLSFTGLSAGLVGLIISGGIFGSKAEEVRKRKNTLLDEIHHLEQRINQDKKINSILIEIIIQLQKMDGYFRDARLALDHLDYMWQTILAEINDSIDKFKTIDNGKRLIQFTIQLKKIIMSWEAVTEYSQYLILLFDNETLNYPADLNRQ